MSRPTPWRLYESYDELVLAAPGTARHESRRT